MIALILTLILVATTAAFLLVSVNYANPLNVVGDNYGKLTVDGFQALGNAYFKATTPTTAAITFANTAALQNNAQGVAIPANSVSDPIATNTDGGIDAIFTQETGTLNETPASAPGYHWVYGKLSSAQYGTPFDSRYFCLTPQAGAHNIPVGPMAKALARARYFFGSDALGRAYVVLSAGACGTAIAGVPVTATLYLQPRQITTP
jgi:hypothetical protein